LFAILGVVLGIIALNKARRNPAVYGGRGLAVGGIVASGFSIILGVIAAVMLLTVVRPVRVEGTAMSPTLNDGDRAFIWLHVEEVKRGDIVTLWYPDDPSKSFIKRVIGLPGETVTIDKSGLVYINGRALDEPYLSPDRNRVPRTIPEIFVKSHYYFVMGDNRDASNDSRSWGLVPEKYIYGEFIGTY
jgi:signal peptidase I